MKYRILQIHTIKFFPLNGYLEDTEYKTFINVVDT